MRHGCPKDAMETERISIHTDSEEQSRHLGFIVGSHMDAPAVIGLTGDLGSGKTVFVQGLARGLAVPERYPVNSPTYTLINEYPGRLPLFHVDLYRIADLEELDNIGFEEVASSGGLVVIEWADRLSSDLLAPDMAVFIDMGGSGRRAYRFFFYRRPARNLIEDLKQFFDSDKE